MNPIYLETRFKRGGENDPTFDYWKVFPVSLLLLPPMQQRVNIGLTPEIMRQISN